MCCLFICSYEKITWKNLCIFRIHPHRDRILKSQCLTTKPFLGEFHCNELTGRSFFHCNLYHFCTSIANILHNATEACNMPCYPRSCQLRLAGVSHSFTWQWWAILVPCLCWYCTFHRSSSVFLTTNVYAYQVKLLFVISIY